MTRLPTPVFVLGSGRSGTTLTASLLNRMSKIHIAKETGFIGQSILLLSEIHLPASRERLIQQVNSWLATEQWNSRATEEGFQRFCEKHSLQGPRAFLHYVWQLDSPVPWEQLEFIGDNTPLYVTCIPALLNLFPEARFIHMVRDPRDVVCSIRKMRFGADDTIAAAFEWHQTIGCWLMAERLINPSLRIECQYETLCSSPVDALGRLAQFLGRDPIEAKAAVESQLSSSRGTGTTFDRVAELPHHARLTEPLNTQRVGRFRSELSALEIQSIEAILQNGMLACGYQPEAWRSGPFVRDDRLELTRAMIRDFFKRSWHRLIRRHARK